MDVIVSKNAISMVLWQIHIHSYLLNFSDTTYSDDLWLGSDNSVNYLAIIFEEVESVGAQVVSMT